MNELIYVLYKKNTYIYICGFSLVKTEIHLYVT